jgi:Amt family ammonium transporter
MNIHLRPINLWLIMLLLISSLHLGAQEIAEGTLDATAAITEAATEATPVIDKGDTAWMITASALVLFMTLPGLALFYGGLVRAKNVLSVLMQCLTMAAVMSLIWVAFGYSLAFSGEGRYIGDLSDAFLSNLTIDSVSGSIPSSVFIMFQMTFFVITPALIVGAFAERMKFSAMLAFLIVWSIFSYLPICHMAWGGGLFAEWSVLDFAGGTVVHINAGIAALVACLFIGKRQGYPHEPIKPHNLPMTVMGTAMLWIGWFGFNAGSELAADGVAGMAMLVTHLATATAALTWMLIEWIKHGKPSVLGIATGAVAGLVAITPASGTAGVMGAILIGALASYVCYFFSTTVKRKFGYDDSLDVFGVHGIGGIVGALMTGVCCFAFMGGSGAGLETLGAQVWAQLKSVLVTIIWSATVSTVTLFIINKTIGLRVSEDEEHRGLDLVLHDEQAYEN